MDHGCKEIGDSIIFIDKRMPLIMHKPLNIIHKFKILNYFTFKVRMDNI